MRTLGMHRVYNSAFMNMLRDEENAKYRSYLKKTVEFDPDILKRYVNFIERTGRTYGHRSVWFQATNTLARFAILMTLPGLPVCSVTVKWRALLSAMAWILNKRCTTNILTKSSLLGIST